MQPWQGLFDVEGNNAAVTAFRLTLQLAHDLRRRMDERLEPDGLTTMQAAALTAVIRLGSASQSQIATAMATSRQNVAQLIQPLLRKGMLEHDLEHGGRRMRVRPTALSADYWARRDADDYAAIRDWFGALSESELDSLVTLLQKSTRGV